jgi:hypothetical protein
MAHNGMVAGGGRLTDQISIGVLAASVARDAVDDAVAVTGRQARRSDGKLPPHVMVYFAMAMALFSDDDYEEVAARLAGTLSSWSWLGRFVERAGPRGAGRAAGPGGAAAVPGGAAVPGEGNGPARRGSA